MVHQVCHVHPKGSPVQQARWLLQADLANYLQHPSERQGGGGLWAGFLQLGCQPRAKNMQTLAHQHLQQHPPKSAPNTRPSISQKCARAVTSTSNSTPNSVPNCMPPCTLPSIRTASPACPLAPGRQSRRHLKTPQNQTKPAPRKQHLHQHPKLHAP